MSFLFGGRREPSKEEKFAMLEVELEASTDLFAKYEKKKALLSDIYYVSEKRKKKIKANMECFQGYEHVHEEVCLCQQ